MRVASLRTLLESLPGDAEVVVPAHDHSYRKVRSVQLRKAGVDGNHIGEWHEDLPNGGGWNEPPDRVIDVLVVDEG